MTSSNDIARARRDGTMLGIPLGDLGWFSTLLMSFATGFAAFFLATFLSIVVMLVYMMVSGGHPDFALTYKRIGFPVGVLVLVSALAYLGTLYIKRKATRRVAS